MSSGGVVFAGGFNSFTAVHFRQPACQPFSGNISSVTQPQLNCRVSILAKHLIALEMKGLDYNESLAVESPVLRASQSPTAQSLIMQDVERHPLFVAALKARQTTQP